MDSNNSHSAEPRVSSVSRLKRVPGTATTHRLQSQGQTWSAGLKGCQDSSNSQTTESRMGLVSRLERVPRTAATHSLQSQEWALSAGLKGARDSSNSHPAEPRVSFVKWFTPLCLTWAILVVTDWGFFAPASTRGMSQQGKKRGSD